MIWKITSSKIVIGDPEVAGQNEVDGKGLGTKTGWFRRASDPFSIRGKIRMKIQASIAEGSQSLLGFLAQCSDHTPVVAPHWQLGGWDFLVEWRGPEPQM